MRICFTADDSNGLESVMSYHFGHCSHYVIVDVEGSEVKDVKTIENPFADEHNPGELPAFMKENGVDVIITGGMGPRAQQYFTDYGIKPVTGAYGKVKDVLEEYLGEKLTFSTSMPEENSNTDSENEEIERLKKEVSDLRRQIAELKSRISEVERKIED